MCTHMVSLVGPRHVERRLREAERAEARQEVQQALLRLAPRGPLGGRHAHACSLRRAPSLGRLFLPLVVAQSWSLLPHDPRRELETTLWRSPNKTESDMNTVTPVYVDSRSPVSGDSACGSRRKHLPPAVTWARNYSITLTCCLAALSR